MKISIKKILNPGLLVVGIVSMLALNLAKSSEVFASAALSAANTYTTIYLPATNLTTISNDTTIDDVQNLGSAGFFWSHEFGFTNEPSNGTAYIGIQGTDRAVFSIFDWPSKEVSSTCKVQQHGFDGGTYATGGTSCIIPYTLTQGDTYRLKVTKIGQDAQGNNWQGTVTNLSTGQTTVIATISVPASWGYISNSSGVWTEDFGNPTPIASCSMVPTSKVTFSNFTGSNSSGNYTISSHADNVSPTLCKDYSNITDNNNDSFTQAVGIKPTSTPPQTTPPSKTTTPSPPGSSPTSSPAPTTSPNTPASPAPSATTACHSSNNLLGFPTWYEYLPCASDGRPQINSLSDVWLIVAAIVEILLRLSALVAIAMMVVGGVKLITSQGEPSNTEKARTTIISALVGLVIAVLAATLVTYIAGRFSAS